MNKMKKIWFKSAFLAMVGMSMTSCGDFLDIYPLTMVYEDNYWNEKNDVDQIVTGCYTRVQDMILSAACSFGARAVRTIRAKGFILNSAQPRRKGIFCRKISCRIMPIPIGRVSILS